MLVPHFYWKTPVLSIRISTKRHIPRKRGSEVLIFTLRYVCSHRKTEEVYKIQFVLTPSCVALAEANKEKAKQVGSLLQRTLLVVSGATSERFH